MLDQNTQLKTLSAVFEFIRSRRLEDAKQALNGLIPPPVAGSSDPVDMNLYGAKYFEAAGQIAMQENTPLAIKSAINHFDNGLRYARLDPLLFLRGLATRSLGYHTREGMHVNLATAYNFFNEILLRSGGVSSCTRGSPEVHIAALQQMVNIAQKIGKNEELPGLIRQLIAVFPNDQSLVDALEEANAVNGSQDELHNSTSRNAAPTLLRKRSFSRYPDQSFFDARTAEIMRALAADTPDIDPFINSNTRFYCLGSCFAREVGIHLRRLGFEVMLTEIGESINNTVTNLQLFRYACNDDCPKEYRAQLDSLLGKSGGILAQRSALDAANVVILTLGVAPAFFDEHGQVILRDDSAKSALRLAGQYSFKTTSVAENVDNIREIIQIVLGRDPKKKIVISVSPVPLKASFEYKSAIVADCVSKSTLRVAADVIVRDGDPRVLYWPSFEMVRWVSGHRGKVYGVDDNSTGHISFSLVEDIVSTFVSTFSTRGENLDM